MARTCFEDYLSSSTNLFMRNANKCLYIAGEGAFNFGSHAAGFGREFSYLVGDRTAAEKFDTVSNVFDTGRTLASVARTIFPIHKLLTGQMFWEIEEKDPKEEGPQIKGWKRNPVTHEYVVRDWSDIAMDVCELVVRPISTTRLLGHMKVINLGSHAQGLSGATMGLWGTFVSMNLVKSIRDLVQETQVKKVKKHGWTVIRGGIDFVGILFDFGLGAQCRPVALFGRGFNMLQSGIALFEDSLS